MSDYTITATTDVPDVLGEYPGEMRMLTMAMDSEQVALTYRHMPPQTGGKGGYGHSHRTQEEVFFVIRGTLTFKLGDDVVDVGPYTAVRIAPPTIRSVWNEGPEDVELVICSPKGDPRTDTVRHEDFWPA
jgi:mannose-6-phosphate isomerase-like protein (cupin superfamily)